MKRLPRFYQSSKLNVGQSIPLDKKASHHIEHVLRMRANDPLVLFNGDGSDYHGVIEFVTRKIVTVKITECSDSEKESALQLNLAQSIVKGQAMDWIIQKAVELGVSSITPLQSNRAQMKKNSHYSEKREQHWQKIIESASEQCGRNRLADLKSTCTLETFLASCQTPIIVLDPLAEKKWEQQEKVKKNLKLRTSIDDYKTLMRKKRLSRLLKAKRFFV